MRTVFRPSAAGTIPTARPSTFPNGSVFTPFALDTRSPVSSIPTSRMGTMRGGGPGATASGASSSSEGRTSNSSRVSSGGSSMLRGSPGANFRSSAATRFWSSGSCLARSAAVASAFASGPGSSSSERTRAFSPISPSARAATS